MKGQYSEEVTGDDGEAATEVHERSPVPGAGPWLARLENTAAMLFILVGVGLVLIRWLGSEDGLPNAELAALAVGAPYSALGLLAILGGRSGRPALMVTAGSTLGFMCTVSAATILLLPFAIFLFVRGVMGLGSGRQRYLGWEEVCLSGVLPAAVLLAFMYLLLHEDPASWRPDEHTFHSTSDIVTVAESILSLGAVALVVVVSFVWIVREPNSNRSSAAD